MTTIRSGYHHQSLTSNHPQSNLITLNHPKITLNHMQSSSLTIISCTTQLHAISDLIAQIALFAKPVSKQSGIVHSHQRIEATTMKRIPMSKVKVGDSIQLAEGQKMRTVAKMVNLNHCTFMVTFECGFWIKLDINKLVEVAE